MRELIDAVYRFLQFIFPKLICFPTAAESELRFHNGKGIQKKKKVVIATTNLFN